MTGNVSIFYQGGSGGFALYYYLLLTGQFQYSIEETWDLIHHQFATELIHNPRSWKSRELWPNNLELKQQPSPQLFLICNPLWNDHMITVNHNISNNTHKILLYTSLKLQLRMAWEKRAYWFTDISQQAFAAPNNDQEYIKWIKQSGVDYNGVTVDPKVPEIVNEFKPDQIVRLEEFASEPATNNQREFLNLWVSLQPKKARCLMHL
jgi:hypothetical protein